MKLRFTRCVAAVLAAGGAISLSANDWPHWRGPDRNGISAETGWTDHLPSSGPAIARRASVLPLLGMISWRTGRSIEWDAAKEQIVGDAEANKLPSRPYRAPWIYPAA